MYELFENLHYFCFFVLLSLLLYSLFFENFMIPKVLDKVYDHDYRKTIKHGGFPVVEWKKVKKHKSSSFFDRFVSFFFQIKPQDSTHHQKSKKTLLTNKTLEEQVKEIIEMEDDKYSDDLLTSELRKYILEFEKDYVKTLRDHKEHIAPSYREMKGSYVNVSGVLGKTYYAAGYPSYIDFLRTRDLLSFYAKRDLTWFVYPTDHGIIQSMLKRRATQLKAEISAAMQK